MWSTIKFVVRIIIDGSNFYHGCKRVAPGIHLTNFSYRDFFEKLTNTKRAEIIYCVGEIIQSKDKKSRELYAQQQKLFYSLEKQKIRICKGFMLFSNGAYHEKGVDVRIAIELVRGALGNEYDECYLVSSDSDLLPAVFEVKKAKKRVIYIGFSDKNSQVLLKNCNKVIKITPKQLLEVR